MPDLELPHLAWPLRRDSTGALVEVEQDTVEDVRQCVNVLLHTQPGVRPLSPDIGIEDLTFTTVDPDVLAATIEAQEDRAQVTVTVAPVNAVGEQQIEIAVDLAGVAPAEEEPAP